MVGSAEINIFEVRRSSTTVVFLTYVIRGSVRELTWCSPLFVLLIGYLMYEMFLGMF